MKLNIEQIKSITTGAVRIFEEDGRVCFQRFTAGQEKIYINENSNNVRFFASAGVRMVFETDATSLNLKVVVDKGSTRKYFAFDVAIDGKVVDSLDNMCGMPNFVDGILQEFELGEYSKEFKLGEGKKTVCIYFPWSVKGMVEEINLENCTYIKPVKPAKKLLAFGDSITQGYDAVNPSNRYVARLADKLGAEEVNKGIGGEVFKSELAKLTEDFVPDYITVAYGTNDWSKKTEDEFKADCREFYVSLSKNYPNSKIFAITPIWRKDYLTERKCGPFADLQKKIVDATSDLENVTVIPGFNFVPDDEKYFADLKVHPNDEGFSYYAENLYNEIIKHI